MGLDWYYDRMGRTRALHQLRSIDRETMQTSERVKIIEENEKAQGGSLFEIKEGQLQRIRSANLSRIQTVKGQVQQEGVSVRVDDAWRFMAIRRLQERLRGQEASIGLQGELDAIVNLYLGSRSGRERWPLVQVQRRRVAERITDLVKQKTGRDYQLEAVRHDFVSSVEAAVMSRPGVTSEHVAMYSKEQENGRGHVRLLRLHRRTGRSILWDSVGRPIRGMGEMKDWTEKGIQIELPFSVLDRSCAKDRIERVLALVGRHHAERKVTPFTLVNVREPVERLETDALREAWKQVPIEHMPIPSQAAARRVMRMVKLLKHNPGKSVRALDNLFEGKGRRHVNATIEAMQWMCACRAATVEAPGNVLMLRHRYVGSLIQPPVLVNSPKGGLVAR